MQAVMSFMSSQHYARLRSGTSPIPTTWPRIASEELKFIIIEMPWEMASLLIPPIASRTSVLALLEPRRLHIPSVSRILLALTWKVGSCSFKSIWQALS
jgi:hypothetical protein